MDFRFVAASEEEREEEEEEPRMKSLEPEGGRMRETEGSEIAVRKR